MILCLTVVWTVSPILVLRIASFESLLRLSASQEQGIVTVALQNLSPWPMTFRSCSWRVAGVYTGYPTQFNLGAFGTYTTEYELVTYEGWGGITELSTLVAILYLTDRVTIRA